MINERERFLLYFVKYLKNIIFHYLFFIHFYYFNVIFFIQDNALLQNKYI